jgi:hypothetical protein
MYSCAVTFDKLVSPSTGAKNEETTTEILCILSGFLYSHSTSIVSYRYEIPSTYR